MARDIKILRVAIVGIGNIGSAHTEAILNGKVSGMALTALCDNSLTKVNELRRKYPGIKIYEDCDALLENESIDALIIATPHYFHTEIAKKAFNKGIHVMSEKPISVDMGSAVSAVELAEEKGLLYGVMFNQRTDPLFIKAKELIASGALGEIRRSVWIITNWYRKQCYYDSGSWRATWNGEGGGVLLNQAPHNLDIWQWLCGMPKSVYAVCHEGKYHEIAVEDDATLYCEYENGASGVFITSTGDYPGTNRLEITGSIGKLVLENGKMLHYHNEMSESEFRATESSVKNPVTVTEYLDSDYNGHVNVLNAFAASVLNGTPLVATGREALNELAISNAAYLSSHKHDKISIPFDNAEFLEFLEEKKASETLKNQKTKELSQGGYKDRWKTNW